MCNCQLVGAVSPNVEINLFQLKLNFCGVITLRNFLRATHNKRVCEREGQKWVQARRMQWPGADWPPPTKESHHCHPFCIHIYLAFAKIIKLLNCKCCHQRQQNVICSISLSLCLTLSISCLYIYHFLPRNSPSFSYFIFDFLCQYSLSAFFCITFGQAGWEAKVGFSRFKSVIWRAGRFSRRWGRRGVAQDTTGAADVCADNLLRDFSICKWQALDVIDSYLICIFQNVR